MDCSFDNIIGFYLLNKKDSFDLSRITPKKNFFFLFQGYPNLLGCSLMFLILIVLGFLATFYYTIKVRERKLMLKLSQVTHIFTFRSNNRCK